MIEAFIGFRNVFFTVLLAFSYFKHQKTHVTSWTSTSSGTDHGGLDCAAPPARAGAGLMVNYGKVGLPHSGRHASPSWWYRETNECMCKYRSTSQHIVRVLTVRIHVWLTGGAPISSDVAGVVVGQDLTERRQRSQLHIWRQGHLRRQPQQGDVITISQNMSALFPLETNSLTNSTRDKNKKWPN